MTYSILTEKETKKLSKFQKKYNIQRVNWFELKPNLFGVEAFTSQGKRRTFDETLKKAFKKLRKEIKTIA